MDHTKTGENPSVEQLKKGIKHLIAEYRQAHQLLEEQKQAVIKNDITSLNQLLEQQVAMYDTLKESEIAFRSKLQSFHHQTDGGTVTLTHIIADLDGPSATLNQLRDQLRADVEQTERLRKQLMDLLQFAQQQNADVFKTICAVAQEDSEAYDSRGQKQSKRANGIAINQKA